MSIPRRRSLIAAALAFAVAAPAAAQKNYAPGVTDTEIKIGQSLPYSGPASAFGAIGRAEQAFFKSINAAGGVNGRKITLISVDDGYSPAKAVEQARRLVEEDKVAAIFNVLGTPLNIAIRKYLNTQKVPQLFIAAGAAQFADPVNFPWTMGWQPTLTSEANFYAADLLRAKPGAKVAVLYQNDDFGKELLAGLKQGLGAKAASMIVVTQSYEATDPTVDSQVVAMQGSGADTVFLFAYPKQAAQAIRRIYDLGWKPREYLHLGSASVTSTMIPAGVEKGVGVLTAGFVKDVTDEKWANDPDFMAWRAWMKAWLPEGDLKDGLNAAGYSMGQMLVQVLKQCGDDLSRENIMRQAANLKNFRLPMLLPGILITTSPTDYRVVKDMKLQRFNGKNWDLVD